MDFNLLHLNVERDRHTDAVFKLIKEKEPQIVCLAEVMYKDVLNLSSSLGYEFAFAPLVLLDDVNGGDQQGSAILSKYKILETEKYRYDDDLQEIVPDFSVGDITIKNGERPKERFSFHYTLLTAKILIEGKKKITVSTTHFPVTDHTTPGYKDHEVKSLKDVDDIEHARVLLDRLIKIIKSINTPTVFTSDLNNPRGEYFYSLLAHELVDQVPISVESSIDPEIHHAKNIKLLVDTIMTSPDFSLKNFEVIEGISDHKAYFASLEI